MANANDTTPAKDDTEALSSVGPEFDTNDSNVDTESFPGFKALKRMLPADRMNLQLQLAKIAAGLPKSFKDGDNADVDFSELSPSDMDSLAGMFTQMQNLVLSASTDEQKMGDWLTDQPEPMEALLYAFGQYQETLGN
nr:MAG TPA: hypothetical protein [Caudoviricetes sp.]